MTSRDIKAAIAKLPKIKEILKARGRIAKKSLGQNFLIDETLVRYIVNSVGQISQPVLEIGPGLGSLTREILYHSNNQPVHVVEKDDDMLPYIRELQSICPNLRIHHHDALHFDESGLTQDKLHIIANLPYNIATALIIKWLKKPLLFSSITIMIQQEVAKRIMASPGTSAYGSLSVFAQINADVEYVADVPPQSFIPKPKVESSVITLRPKAQKDYDFEPNKLERILKMSFAQRRKMLKSGLHSCFKDDTLKILDHCGIAHTARAEELTIADFVNLSQHL